MSATKIFRGLRDALAGRIERVTITRRSTVNGRPATPAEEAWMDETFATMSEAMTKLSAQFAKFPKSPR